jgi:hypothetical protein
MKRRRRGFDRVAVAFLVALLVLVTTFGLVVAEPQLINRSTTVTKTITQVSTTTATVISIENETETSSATSERNSGSSGVTASTLSPDGLVLSASTNSSTILVGQSLMIDLSITNVLPITNSLNASDAIAVTSNWPFQGVPAALWPECDTEVPAEVAILQGNYTSQELRTTATHPNQYPALCASGADVLTATFMPVSNQVNITANSCVVSCSNLSGGPFRTALNFTTSGYWAIQDLWQVGPILSNAPSTTTFGPGLYTIAVGDEWGQVLVLYLTVLTASQ